MAPNRFLTIEEEEVSGFWSITSSIANNQMPQALPDIIFRGRLKGCYAICFHASFVVA